MSFYKLGQFLKDINVDKKNLLRLDSDAHKDYSPFIVNRVLGAFKDTILHVNQLNIREFASKQMQYDYLINAVKKRSRYTDKIQKKENPNIILIMKYYGYTRDKAEAAEKILPAAQIKLLQEKSDKGGR